MGFKEQVITDLGSVFLPSTSGREAEFEDTVAINGAEVACVLDEEEATHTTEGVIVRESTLYVRATDLDAPVVDQRMTIGGRQANVVRVDEQQGMRVIRLQWFDS